MISNSKSVGTIAVALFAGYNAILFMVAGMLLSSTHGLAGPRFWCVLGGVLLFMLGFSFLSGIYGFWTSRAWGRVLLWRCILASLPLYTMAIFPIFQNEQMTSGNTLLQMAWIVFSFVVLKALRRPRIKAVVEHSDGQPVEEGALDEEDEAPAFTFDRNRKDSDLFP